MARPTPGRSGAMRVGALLTGVFAAPALGGAGIWDYVANKASPDYSIWGQVVTQGTGVFTTIVVSGVVSLIAFKLVDLTIGLRVSRLVSRPITGRIAEVRRVRRVRSRSRRRRKHRRSLQLPRHHEVQHRRQRGGDARPRDERPLRPRHERRRTLAPGPSRAPLPAALVKKKAKPIPRGSPRLHGGGPIPL